MLQFDHWEMIEDDPFVLTKALDSEDYGTQNVTPNVAKKYIDKIRERKGLLIDKKLVVDGNKQTNLSKKK
jgi:ribosome assembly protein 1